MKNGEEVRNPFLPRSPEDRVVEAVERLKFDVQYALQAAMKKRGVDQAELARRLGVTPARVSQMFADDANLRLNSVAKAFAVLDEDIEFSSASAPPVPRMKDNADSEAASGRAVSHKSGEVISQHVALRLIENEARKHEALERRDSFPEWPRRRSPRSEKRKHGANAAEQWQTVAVRSGPAPASVRYMAANEQASAETNGAPDRAA